MQNERKAFGRLCPNSLANFSSRIQDRKPSKEDSKKEPPKIVTGNVPVSIYIEETSNIVDEAFATIAWQDLEECTSVLQRESGSVQQQNAQIPNSGYDLPVFEDAVGHMIPDHPALMQPCLDSVSLQLPSCDVADFEGCVMSPIPALPEHSLHSTMTYTALSHAPHEGLSPHAEQYWKHVADHNQKALGDALQANNQLHVTLNRKQEEIASLQERNIHLKELADQAKHLASVLDRLMTQPNNANHPTAESCQGNGGIKRRRLEDCFEPVPGCKEVDDILKDITDKCNAVLHRDSKQPRLQQEAEENGSDNQGTGTINMHGAFNGLKTCTTRHSIVVDGGDMEEGMSFKTSIRDHCTIRTLAFPQGNAFTTRTPSGGYKFRWVPS
ncbi:multicilin isoform X1 [Lepisosteus oculatus]|uniref:multicilin isoform X1 n=1 Tax=Lepisosteus oculatus TaxID=7918 RepID=UPI0007405019|nr:PREDICTED: multicilin isoform X1 [Lepisosteus oculatus]